jgi:AraC-like DNA-binding protein
MGPDVERSGTATAQTRSAQIYGRSSWFGSPLLTDSQTHIKLARRKEMADEKSNRDFLDRRRLSVDEYYEVEHFARENGVSPSQVSRLIKKNGNDRMTLTQAVRELRDQK